MPEKRRVKRHPVVQPRSKLYRLIPLTRNLNTLVDAKDYRWLSQWNWYALYSETAKSFYAARADRAEGKLHILLMHREILGCKHGEEGDHRDHHTLDNRRQNIRRCTVSQNRCNTRLRSDSTSGYKGVSFDRSRGKWTSDICVNGRSKRLGRFDSPEEAALAYNQAAKKFFGEFALLNHLIS